MAIRGVASIIWPDQSIHVGGSSMVMATSRRPGDRPRDGDPLQARAQVRTLYDALPLGLAYLDADLRFVQVNDRFAALGELPAAACACRTIADVAPLFARVLEPMCRLV
ncbi:MAG: PAS domain-containing protein, partial [Steroidobacteraceae bacterium]